MTGLVESDYSLTISSCDHANDGGITWTNPPGEAWNNGVSQGSSDHAHRSSSIAPPAARTINYTASHPESNDFVCSAINFQGS